MANNSVVVSILADAAQFSKTFDTIGERTSGLSKGMKTLGLGLAAGVGIAAGALVGLGVEAFKAAAEVERIGAQTAAAIRSTGGAAGRSVEQISGLADSLERMSGIEAESIQTGQNLLLTFTNIQGANFDAATKSALDMSVAMGTDMSSAATLVGKALNDPIAGVSALSRVGVQLTDSQKETIAQMVEMGDVAGAQGVILDELNKQFGGSAEAFGGTFLGTIEKVKNAFGSIGESLAVGLMPAASAVMGKIATLLDNVAASPAFAAIVQNVNDFITSLVSGESGVGSFIGQALELAASFSPLGIVIQAITPLLPQLAGMFASLAATLGGALGQVLPVIAGLATTLAGALSGTLAAVLPTIVGLIGTLAGVFTTLLPALMPIVEILGGALSTVITTLAPIFATLAATLGQVLGQALTALAPLFTMLAGILVQVLEALMPIVPAIMPLVSAVLALLSPLLSLIGAALEPLIKLFIAILAPILELIAPLISLLMPAIEGVSAVVAFLIEKISGIIGWFVELISGSKLAADGFTSAFKAVPAFFSGLIAGVVGFFSDGIGNIVRFFTELPGKIVGALAGLSHSLVDIGRNMIQGLIDGAGSLLRNLGSFFLDMVPDWIVGPFKAALGIRSPSRVFRDLGVYTIEGLEQGLSQLGGVRSTMREVTRAVMEGYDPTTRVVSSSRLAASTASPSEVVAHLSPADRILLQRIAEAAGITLPGAAVQSMVGAANASSSRRRVA